MLFGKLLEEGGRGGLAARLSGPQRSGDQAQRCNGSGSGNEFTTVQGHERSGSK
jgi:hypothetical protein